MRDWGEGVSAGVGRDMRLVRSRVEGCGMISARECGATGGNVEC